jgi:hypothetical protein
MRPPGKTSAACANAMPPARSHHQQLGWAASGSRTTIRVAAGIARRPCPQVGARQAKEKAARRAAGRLLSFRKVARGYMPLTFCSSSRSDVAYSPRRQRILLLELLLLRAERRRFARQRRSALLPTCR